MINIGIIYGSSGTRITIMLRHRVYIELMFICLGLLHHQGVPIFAEACSFVKNNLYVEDGVISVENYEKAIDLINKTVSLCAKTLSYTSL